MADDTTSTTPTPGDTGGHDPGRAGRMTLGYIVAIVIAAVMTFLVAALLVNIFTRQQEERQPYVRLVEVNELTTDPVPWGKNWPRQFGGYRETVDVTQTRYGGSEAMPEQKLENDPWLRRLYAGYAFSIDYRERRGHAYMLYDQEQTERVLKKPQSGACLHCHASITPTWRRVGLEALGQSADEEALKRDFNWDAVMKGFEVMSAMNYTQAHAELLKTSDGTPEENVPLFPGGSSTAVATPANVADAPPAPSAGAPTTQQALAAHMGEAHPVSCIDCHDPNTMLLRVTRPGFVRGIQALAESDDPVPHLRSVERWRQGDRKRPYDPNVDASRQEMRSFACAQCHVEYYCATKETLFFPWHNGLKVEQIELTYDNHTFPDGTPFMDYKHGETGAPVYKAQHPEFELWSQGTHARAGVACADCHMPYQREGALKVSQHWIKSPLLMINQSCQPCHNVPESELLARAQGIQDRTRALLDRSAIAVVDMLDAIRDAKSAGATEEQLAPVYKLQRSAQWRLDFVSSENSMGFHADQEAARILAESMDMARQAQALALSLRAPQAPETTAPVEPIQGVTPSENAPPAPYDTRGIVPLPPNAPQ